MIAWRPIHKKRFEAILLEIEAGLSPKVISSGGEADALTTLHQSPVSVSNTEPQASNIAEIVEESRPPAQEETETAELEQTESTRMELDRTEPDQTEPEEVPDQSEASHSIETPTAAEDEIGSTETASDSTTADSVEVDKIAATSAESHEPSLAPEEAATLSPEIDQDSDAEKPVGTQPGEKEDVISGRDESADTSNEGSTTSDFLRQPAKSFFLAVPWSGEVQDSSLGETPPVAAERYSPPTVDFSRRVEVLSVGTKAIQYFQSLPWSGEASGPPAQASALHNQAAGDNRIQFKTTGEDAGAPVDEAPSAQNMLMAGMMSAAKTSRRIKSRDEAANKPARQDPAQSKASDFFNHINWKKSA